MTKYLFMAGILLFSAGAFADKYGDMYSSVQCQPKWPDKHFDDIVYENARVKALTFSYVTCPINVNNQLLSTEDFSSLVVWVRVNNSDSSDRVQCRLKNFDWRGQQELNTPWVVTNNDGYGNATLTIPAEYIKREGQTTMECEMPASTYIENYKAIPYFEIDPL